MSTPDEVIDAPDPFSVLGLERRFEIDPARLDSRHDALVQQVQTSANTEAAGSAKSRVGALATLNAARLVLADPVLRGTHLLHLSGGAGDRQTDGRPPGFREKLNGWISSLAASGRVEGETLDAVGRERTKFLAEASRLFRALGSADNGVVQRHRRQQIRAALAAVCDIDERFEHGGGPDPLTAEARRRIFDKRRDRS